MVLFLRVFLSELLITHQTPLTFKSPSGILNLEGEMSCWDGEEKENTARYDQINP